MNNKDYIMSKMNNAIHTYSFYAQNSTCNTVTYPIYAGSYQIGQFSFSIEKKPNWFHRTMMKLFFGIVWKDK